MNSPNLPHQHVINPIKEAATPSNTVPEQPRADSAAANDSAVPGRQMKEKPLWNLAIALMVLCGAAVFLIAFS